MWRSRVPLTRTHFFCALHAPFSFPTRPLLFFLIKIALPLLSNPLSDSHRSFHRNLYQLPPYSGDLTENHRSYISKMGSKTPSTSTDEANGTVDDRSKKGKVPKRIHKAVRERLKREHLNELFIELADSLELNQQNNGKASILSEATRFLKDLFSQIESLRKEHTSLISESHYVTTEKNELKEETSVLETEISTLQTEIEARANQSKPDLNTSPAPDYQFPGLPVYQGAGFQQPSAPPTTVIVVPMQPDHQTHDISDTTTVHMQQTQVSMIYNSNVVSKPCPRYASATDSWSSRLLSERLEASE